MKRLRVLMMAAIAATMLFGGVAQASANEAVEAPHVTQVTVHEVDALAAAEEHCPILRGTHWGTTWCGRTIVDWVWSDGHLETFVVGTNNAVYHIFQRNPNDAQWSGWISMGGQTYYGVQTQTLNPPVIKVWGTKGGWYFNKWTGGNPAWTGWKTSV